MVRHTDIEMTVMNKEKGERLSHTGLHGEAPGPVNRQREQEENEGKKHYREGTDKAK